MLSRLGVHPRWGAAVAFGGAQALGGFYPWGLHAAHRPGVRSPGCVGGRGHPRLSPPRPGPRSRALHPVTTSNALPARSYRNCWHIVSPGLGRGAARVCPPGRGPQHSPRHENASSGLRPVTKIPHCCLGWGCLEPQVAGRPLSPARDRGLGTPLLIPRGGTPPRGADPGLGTEGPALRAGGDNPHALRTLGSPPPPPLGGGSGAHVSGVSRAFTPSHSQTHVGGGPGS